MAQNVHHGGGAGKLGMSVLMFCCVRRNRNQHSYIRLSFESNRNETGTCQDVVVLKREMSISTHGSIGNERTITTSFICSVWCG